MVNVFPEPVWPLKEHKHNKIKHEYKINMFSANEGKCNSTETTLQDFSLQSINQLNEAKSGPAGATYNEGLTAFLL